MKTINNQTFDVERALYNENSIKVIDCSFEGEADGESALKECRNIVIENCRFHKFFQVEINDKFQVL